MSSSLRDAAIVAAVPALMVGGLVGVILSGMGLYHLVESGALSEFYRKCILRESELDAAKRREVAMLEDRLERGVKQGTVVVGDDQYNEIRRRINNNVSGG